MGRGAGNVWRVGPGRPLERALAQAADGDVVELEEGEHRGQVGVVHQRALTLRGAGRGAVLHADGRDAEGKAIVVVRGGDVRVDNVTFRGARVRDANGAGIRFERGRLTVTRCGFFDNQMGLLTGNTADAELHVADSRFGEAPDNPQALAHLLYVGRIARFALHGCRLGGGRRGHLVKSRARAHAVVGNRLVDAPAGQASYELEFPNGGDALVAANVLHQSARSLNRTLLAFGAEGFAGDEPSAPPRVHRLQLLHNTFVSDGGAPAYFVRVYRWRWLQAGLSAPSIEAAGNLFAGPGLADVDREGGPPGGNLAVAADALPGAAAGDYRLAAGHRLHGSGVGAPPTD